jgi:hypothetical protein
MSHETCTCISALVALCDALWRAAKSVALRSLPATARSIDGSVLCFSRSCICGKYNDKRQQQEVPAHETLSSAFGG